MSLGLFLRFFLIDQQSLWIDEGYSLQFSDGPSIRDSLNALLETTLSDRFRVLYYLVLFYWRQWFGDTELAIRSLSAVSGFATMLLTYVTARQVFGWRHALWSLSLVSFSAYCIYYSQEARDYAFGMSVMAAQVCVLSICYREPTLRHVRRYQILFAVLTAVGLFMNVIMACASAGLAISHLYTTRRLRPWLQWWLPATVLSLVPMGFYLAAPLATTPSAIVVSRSDLPLVYNFVFVVYGLLAGITFGPPQSLLRGSDKLQVLIAYWPSLVMLAGTGLSFAVLLFRQFRRDWKNDQLSVQFNKLLLATIVISLAFSVMFALVTGMNWVPRHAFFVWPLLALLLPSVVSRDPDRQDYSRYWAIATLI
ncbi:MAG: glycosyltransferase family 39 protein, partial [Pirellulales bacterium]|nr:glycosyltransferase family 39 protein [Pirellulales bacterium]